MYHAINTKNYEEFHKYVDKDILNIHGLISIVASDDAYFIKYVVAKGIDLRDYRVDDWTLLFWASAPVIPILLSNGLDVNHVDSYGQNALLAQCDTGHPDEVCELIRNGCDINLIDNSGNTALTIAIENDNFKLVEVLLEKGAIGIQTTLYNQIRDNKLQITNLTEQSRDLMMYRDFYELCHF